MRKSDIIRAWRDDGYRRGLSPQERARLPPNPAGEVELADSELHGVDGRGCNPKDWTSGGFCPSSALPTGDSCFYC